MLTPSSRVRSAGTRTGTVFFILTCACCLLTTALPAQNHRCDWSVVDIGGGTMSSANYQSGVSVGQSAAGQMIGTSSQVFIGFWQIETTLVGIQEEQHWLVE